MRAVVTGGAGFIGSHLVDALLDRGDHVTVLDDLSNGRFEQVPAGVVFVQGDVSDEDVVRSVVEGADVVFHEAALGSVRRSVDAPLATDRVNIHGTLNVLEASRRAGVRRVMTASSSSVYGGVAPLPSNEEHPTTPKSPYAVTKVTVEQYCRVYAQLLGLETVCLRYFNVYGPRQRSDSAYAAVVPLFVQALLDGRRPVIEGDGLQSRDFTYIDDVVRANLLAGSAPADRCSGHVFNVGGGGRHSVVELLEALARILGLTASPVHVDPRPGDVRDSEADLTAVGAAIGYSPEVDFEEGLRRVCAAAQTTVGGRKTT